MIWELNGLVLLKNLPYNLEEGLVTLLSIRNQMEKGSLKWVITFKLTILIFHRDSVRNKEMNLELYLTDLTKWPKQSHVIFQRNVLMLFNGTQWQLIVGFNLTLSMRKLGGSWSFLLELTMVVKLIRLVSYSFYSTFIKIMDFNVC